VLLFSPQYLDCLDSACFVTAWEKRVRAGSRLGRNWSLFRTDDALKTGIHPATAPGGTCFAACFNVSTDFQAPPHGVAPCLSFNGAGAAQEPVGKVIFSTFLI